MGCGKDWEAVVVLRAGVGGGGGMVVEEGQGEELVHVLADEHVGVEEDDAGVGGHGKDGKLGEGVEEAGVVCVPGGRWGLGCVGGGIRG